MAPRQATPDTGSHGRRGGMPGLAYPAAAQPQHGIARTGRRTPPPRRAAGQSLMADGPACSSGPPSTAMRNPESGYAGRAPGFGDKATGRRKQHGRNRAKQSCQKKCRAHRRMLAEAASSRQAGCREAPGVLRQPRGLPSPGFPVSSVRRSVHTGARQGQDGYRMTDKPGGPRLRLELARQEFGRVERPVAHEMRNALLMLNLKLQARSCLRAEGYRVYMLSVLSTAQRFMRGSESARALNGPTHLPRRLRRNHLAAADFRKPWRPAGNGPPDRGAAVGQGHDLGMQPRLPMHCRRNAAGAERVLGSGTAGEQLRRQHQRNDPPRRRHVAGPWGTGTARDPRMIPGGCPGPCTPVQPATGDAGAAQRATILHPPAQVVYPLPRTTTQKEGQR